jgi:putative inorganic carbon (hco3(-)) transporter
MGMGTGLGHYIPLVAYLGFCAMCIIAFWRPTLGFYYLMPFIPYRAMRDHFLDYPLGGNLITILVIAIIVGSLVKGKSLPKTKLYPIWLVTVIYLYISMWFGTAMGNAPPPLWLSDSNFITWKDYLLIPMIFVAAGLAIRDRKSIRIVIIIIAISLLLIDRSSILESMSRSFAHFDESKRDAGPMGWAGPNGLAAFLAQFAMFFWGFAQFVKKRKHKWFCYGLVAITLFATMYTFSRASYIAVLVTTLILGILKDRKLVLLMLAFVLTWQTIVPVAVTERINMTENSNGHLEASAGTRVELWEEAEESILSSPLLGMGFDTYQYGHHAGNLQDTHNWYVKVLVETGVLGILLVGLMLQQMLSLSYRLYRNASDPLYQGLGLGLFLAVIACIILNFFGDRWNFPEIIGFLFVLCAAATRALELEASPITESVAAVEMGAPSNPYLMYR